jgi:hypothetical protein
VIRFYITAISFGEIETKPVNMIPETDRMIVDNYWNLFMEKFRIYS